MHMAQQADLQLLTLAGIAHRCTQETELFFRRQGYDPRPCFELFRRAIVGRSQQAWAHVYTQYRPLVVGWIDRHSAFPDSGEEVQYFVNRAFEKMWSALTPEKFAGFPDLKSLLRYLQVCVHSVILDQVRKVGLDTLSIDDETRATIPWTDGQSSENQVLAQVHRQELWQEINARLNDDKERKVVYGTFVLALKPREVYAQFSETFGDVKEVYRVKENVIARLRRDTELQKFFGGDA
jgi:DNA-directed RNA polymerase specialized sigma24 family protein